MSKFKPAGESRPSTEVKPAPAPAPAAEVPAKMPFAWKVALAVWAVCFFLLFSLELVWFVVKAVQAMFR